MMFLMTTNHESQGTYSYQDKFREYRIKHETIEKVLEDSLMPDFRILTILHALLRKKVVTVSESAGPLLEETFIHRPG